MFSSGLLRAVAEPCWAPVLEVAERLQRDLEAARARDAAERAARDEREETLRAHRREVAPPEGASRW